MTTHTYSVEAQNICFSVGSTRLIDNIDVAINEQSFTAIIGPNGAGKTTLLNLINGDSKPHKGSVSLQQQPLNTIDALQLAKMRAVLPQLAHIPFAIQVRDIVALGREPYRYDVEKSLNNSIIDRCLSHMDITHLAQHHYATLSGGEQHRVQIARTLSQIYSSESNDLTGKILFLDEPTNHLDIQHQYALMQLLKKLQHDGLTIICVMHDLSLALQFADHIMLLEKGRKVGDYSPQQLVESDALSAVYNMSMTIKWDSDFGRYILIPAVRSQTT